jgi:hypothetical protein
VDGSGANAWAANDAVVNTGQAGGGFLELYQDTSLRGDPGPALAVWGRNSATWDDIGCRAKLGNLNGARGYSSTTWGAWFGRYGSGYTWIGVDDVNGMRIMDYTTQRFRVDTSGAVTIGNPSDWNTYVYAGGLQLRNGSTAWLTAAAATLRIGTSGVGDATLSFAGGAIYAYKILTADPLTMQTLFSISGTEIALETGDFVIQNTGTLRIHTTAALTGDGVWASYNSGTPLFRVGTISGGALERGIYWNGADIQIKSDRMTLDDIGGVYQIANWTFDLYSLYSFTGKVSINSQYGRITLNDQAGIDGDDATWRIWAGSAWSGRATAPFRVNSSGALWATNATIAGAISGSTTVSATLSLVGAAGSINSGAGGLLTGDGYYLDYNSGTPRLRVGTVSGGALVKGLLWDGSECTIKNGNGLILNDDGLRLPVGTSGTALLAWLDGANTRGQIWVITGSTPTCGYLGLNAWYNSDMIQFGLQAESDGEVWAELFPAVTSTMKGLMIGGAGGTQPSSMLDVIGDVEIYSNKAYYIGDPTTNDSWRMVRSGNDLVLQRRESGSWVTKQTIAA